MFGYLASNYPCSKSSRRMVFLKRTTTILRSRTWLMRSQPLIMPPCNVNNNTPCGNMSRRKRHKSIINNNHSNTTNTTEEYSDSAEAVAVNMAAAAAAAYGNHSSSLSESSSDNMFLAQSTHVAKFRRNCRYHCGSSGTSHVLFYAHTHIYIYACIDLYLYSSVFDFEIKKKQLQQRESLAVHMSRNDCSYLKALLSLFPSAEARGDYGALATLAACIKTILLMNDPSTIELIITETPIYEQVCSTLEYDPDLRDKANHRWFLERKSKVSDGGLHGR